MHRKSEPLDQPELQLSSKPVDHLIRLQLEGEPDFSAELVGHPGERRGWQRLLEALDRHHGVIRLPHVQDL